MADENIRPGQPKSSTGKVFIITLLIACAIGGAAVYLILNGIIKLPFDNLIVFDILGLVLVLFVIISTAIAASRSAKRKAAWEALANVNQGSASQAQEAAKAAAAAQAAAAVATQAAQAAAGSAAQTAQTAQMAQAGQAPQAAQATQVPQVVQASQVPQASQMGQVVQADQVSSAVQVPQADPTAQPDPELQADPELQQEQAAAEPLTPTTQQAQASAMRVLEELHKENLPSLEPEPPLLPLRPESELPSHLTSLINTGVTGGNLVKIMCTDADAMTRVRQRLGVLAADEVSNCFDLGNNTFVVELFDIDEEHARAALDDYLKDDASIASFIPIDKR